MRSYCAVLHGSVLRPYFSVSDTVKYDHLWILGNGWFSSSFMTTLHFLAHPSYTDFIIIRRGSLVNCWLISIMANSRRRSTKDKWSRLTNNWARFATTRKWTSTSRYQQPGKIFLSRSLQRKNLSTLHIDIIPSWQRNTWLFRDFENGSVPEGPRNSGGWRPVSIVVCHGRW